jgi:hypothetical protein
MNKGTLIEITNTQHWYETDTIQKHNLRESIQVESYKVERLSVLDKKLIEYVNKYDFRRLEKKMKTRFKKIEDMYTMHKIHPTVIKYIEER